MERSGGSPPDFTFYSFQLFLKIHVHAYACMNLRIELTLYIFIYINIYKVKFVLRVQITRCAQILEKN